MRKAVAAMAAGVLAAGLVPASAEAAPRLKVVAKGLDNPRGLVVGGDGTVYVAESGNAGSKCVGTGEARMCLGSTGAVTAIKKNGRKKRIHKGLPSLGLRNSSTSGAQDLAFDAKGRLRLLLGGMSRAELKKFGPGARRLSTVVRLPGRQVVADLAAFEARNNPDGTPPAMDGLNSNPQSFVINRDGSMVVADGGANDVLHVSKNGRVRLLSLLPPQCAELPEGFPADQAPPPGDCAEGQVPAESVPTSVVKGPDGAYYVGELTGFPFAEGSARIWRITKSGKRKVVATGFTNVIDLAFDRRGRLLVLEISHKGLLSGSTQGALIRLSKGGKKTVLLSKGLVGPTGLAVTEDGRHAYISNAGVPGPEGGGKPHKGQVLRYRL